MAILQHRLSMTSVLRWYGTRHPRQPGATS